MSPMTPAERDAAERRVEEIRVEIQALLASTTPDEERHERWVALLRESIELQEQLDENET